MKVPASKRLESAASVDGPSDYYYRFKRFCSFYPLREQHLAYSILDTVGKPHNSKSSSFSILDIGSSDGALLAEVIGLLRASADIELHCVAVEPDPVAFARLEVMAALLRKPGKVIISCIQANIEAIIAGAGRQPIMPHKFDFILCSHVFYHLTDWSRIMTKFLSLLNPQGCAVVILDSHNSPVYQFREYLRTIFTDSAGAAITVIQEYGDLTSAEDFLKFLRFSGISYSQSELDWKLTLNSYRFIADLEDMLTFLYRFPVNVREKAQQAVQEFATRSQHGSLYVFPWKEGLFVIPR